MLLDFARAGAESDVDAKGVERTENDRSTRATPDNNSGGGGTGDGAGGSGGGTEERGVARVPSKVMAKAQQLYDEHATNEHRKERRRKVSEVVAVHRARDLRPFKNMAAR